MAKNKNGSGFSRRKFLKGVGVGTGALSAGLLSPAETLSHAGGALAFGTPQGPGAVPITLHINGQAHRLSVEPRVTLLDALRMDLEITGAKRVCDRGTCGACSMLLDGKVIYGCSMLAIDAQGHEITTVEGLSHNGRPHPLMTAFVAHDGQQCGFCTPGFIVASKAFLDRTPHPTREQVNHGLGGNLCRCGTYHGIREAVLDVGNPTGKAKTGGQAHGAL